MAETVRDVLRNPWVKFAGLIFSVLLFFFGIYLVKDILVFIAIAFVLAYVLSPVVDRLEKYRIPRYVSSPVLVAGMVGLVGLGLFLFVMDVQREVGKAFWKQPRPAEQGTAAPKAPAGKAPEAPAQPPSKVPPPDAGSKAWVEQQVQKLVEKLPEKMQPAAKRLAELLYEHVAPRIEQIFASLGDFMLSIVTSIGSLVTTIFMLVLSLVLSVYTLNSLPRLKQQTRSLLPAAYKVDILRMVRAIDADVRGFIRGQLLVALSLSIMYLIGLSILGVPYAVPIAVIGGLGNMMPYVGTAAGIFLAEVSSILTDGFGANVPLVIAVFAVGQAVEAGIITPKVIGGAVGMNPVAIIVAFLVFSKLFGFFGGVFAVPMASVVRVLGKELLMRAGRSEEIELPPEVPPPEKAKPDEGTKT